MSPVEEMSRSRRCTAVRLFLRRPENRIDEQSTLQLLTEVAWDASFFLVVEEMAKNKRLSSKEMETNLSDIQIDILWS